MIFVVLAAWIVAGPIYRQIFGQPGELIRAWQMFHDDGIGAVEARFYQVEDDGSWTLLDRYAVVQKAEESRRALPYWFWVMQSHQDVLRVTAMLCRALGEDADVRVVSRIAEPTGWVDHLPGYRNRCPDALSAQFEDEAP